jgi:hypothetical protein
LNGGGDHLYDSLIGVDSPAENRIGDGLNCLGTWIK